MSPSSLAADIAPLPAAPSRARAGDEGRPQPPSEANKEASPQKEEKRDGIVARARDPNLVV